ncbi:MAG: exodeoxyribonuclease VII large subunit [Spirochaetota bacterium]
MEEQVYSISQITAVIKQVLQNTPELNGVWIRGEISNVTYHSSGHIYFTLKDEKAVISAVFFKNVNKNLTFRMKEGMTILAFGGVSLFERRGSYQFMVYKVRQEGMGELLQKIEELRKKLYDEGLFDPARKKPLPQLPRKIGVLTSPTGAAVRDIIKVAMRRFPNIEILLAPAKVQGEGSVESIVLGIEELNRPEWGVDVIIAGRGGGSFEDLMAFNEEPVVRAFANSRLPIISAVGHQIDHPLSDEAADVAAATPSQAAELALPVKRELHDTIQHYLQRAYRHLLSGMRDYRTRLTGVQERRVFRNPMELVQYRQMTLTDIENQMSGAMQRLVNLQRNRLYQVPDLSFVMQNLLQKINHRYQRTHDRIINLSPVGILKRGYSITTDSRGNIVSSIASVGTGEKVDVTLYNGALNCLVENITSEVEIGKKGKEAGEDNL